MKVRFVGDRQVTDCLWHLRCTRLPPLVSPLFDPSRLISLVPLLALITPSMLPVSLCLPVPPSPVVLLVVRGSRWGQVSSVAALHTSHFFLHGCAAITSAADTT
ncbi:hypothetical protein TcCL_Unassigned01161 [Trypanosoma cruzi]|nr:hypothetical protein TcCL_Unassigned01161 [Trypanosoma cruzi]